jgi:putative transposase
VRAGLVRRPEDWRWSSAGPRLGVGRDPLAETGALLERIPDWRTLLDGALDTFSLDAIRSRERTGYALGGPAFLEELESRLGRRVGPGPRGRPPRSTSHRNE